MQKREEICAIWNCSHGPMNNIILIFSALNTVQYYLKFNIIKFFFDFHIFKRIFFNLYISWSPFFGLFFRTPNFERAAFFFDHIWPSIETCSETLYVYTKHIKPKFRPDNPGFSHTETFKRHPVSSVNAIRAVFSIHYTTQHHNKHYSRKDSYPPPQKKNRNYLALCVYMCIIHLSHVFTRFK